jgi:hypothetical protein
MRTLLGPIPREKIILCSADAGPRSQRDRPENAGNFFPNAPWVGALRNYAESLNCRFVILTTGHGLVEPDDIISPYDMHIDVYPTQVAETWNRTVRARLARNRNSLMLFYAGGCPRDRYVAALNPILLTLGISLLTFGRPFMVDVNKIEECVEMLVEGTSLEEIAAILGHPDRLEFYYHV